MNLLISLLFTSLIGTYALAEVPAMEVDNRVSTSVSSFEGRDRVYYNCDAVEAAALDLLQAMGATVTSLRCSGGIEHGRLDPAYVRATFTQLVPTDSDKATHSGEYTDVSLQGRESRSGVIEGHSCHLMQSLFRSFRRKFNLENVKAKFNCSGSLRRYTIEFTALK